MAVTTDTHFSFASKALAANTFSVVRFSGTEGLSRLYEYEILVSAADAEIDLEEVTRNAATLTIHGHADDVRVHGAVARFEQLHEIRGRFLYRARLVPRLAHADLSRENQLFLDKTVPEVIEAVLKRAGLTTSDYKLKLKRSYPKWEYICQYDETNFAFISRWMEREGIYYFFDQGDDAETLVITDSKDAHEAMAGADLRYVPRSSMVAEHETVAELVCRQTWLPHRVVLGDYNYRKPSLDLKAEAIVDAKGRGDVFSWGEHFKTPEEGKRLAELRAEEIRCTEQVFHGEATTPAMHPGVLFSIEEHYRDSYNQQYLILEITHEGAQPEAYVTDGVAQQAGSAQSLEYRNSFTAIPASVQFRPSRTTRWPQLSGTVNARVDAAGDGKYAEVDDQGRYKVRLPFDESGAAGGKASRWVRMAQPHAGPNYGMHFPLHKDAEVLLTFIDGDPDRPIIAAAVPNPESVSPVSNANQTQSVIRTGGQNEIVIEDTEDGQKVTIQQKCGNAVVLDGTKDRETMTLRQACGNVLTLDGTKGSEKAELKDKYGNQILLDSKPGDEHIRIYSPHHNSGVDVGRSWKNWTDSDSTTFSAGNVAQAVIGTQGSLLVGAGLDVKLANVCSLLGGVEFSFTAGAKHAYEFGYSFTYSQAAAIKSVDADCLTTAKDDQVIVAGKNVCLLSGAEGTVAAGNRAVLDLYPEKAVLSIGRSLQYKGGTSVDGNPYQPKDLGLQVGALFTSALMTSAGLAAGLQAGAKGEEPGTLAAIGAPTAAAALLQILALAAAWKAVRPDKLCAVEHTRPTASVTLQKDGTVEVQSTPKTGSKGGIVLKATKGDIVLDPADSQTVYIAKVIKVAKGQVTFRDALTIRTA